MQQPYRSFWTKPQTVCYQFQIQYKFLSSLALQCMELFVFQTSVSEADRWLAVPNAFSKKHLPGSAYYSEWDTVTKYDATIFNDMKFKFALYKTEIMPIVKYIAAKATKDNDMVILNDSPLITTVPSRLSEVMSPDVIKKPLSKQYYENLLKLSQIVMSRYKFMSAMISGLSIHIKTTTRVRKYLMILWGMHCLVSMMNMDEYSSNRSENNLFFCCFFSLPLFSFE